MKTQITLKISTLLILLLTLTACAANPVTLAEDTEPRLFSVDEFETNMSLEDGIYFSKTNDFNEDGWKLILNFEVYNSEIIDISFDAVNESAASRKKDLSASGIVQIESEDEQSTLRWDEQVKLLENYILTNQIIDFSQLTAEKIFESHAGFTLDIQPFIELAYSAVANGPIEIGPYRDGFYFAEHEEFTDGFKPFVRLFVKNGYIIAVDWNAINEDGVRLLTDFNLEDTDDTWREQATRLERFLLDIQDPTQITFDSENKTTNVFGVSIEVNDFIELVIQALASGPLL